MPLVAAHALLVTGKRNFDDNSFSMSFMDIVDGLYSTVPTLISFAVMVGKMAPIQNVVLAIMNVTAYAFNYWVNVYVMGTFDGTGGAVTTHIFGAFFGMHALQSHSPWRRARPRLQRPLPVGHLFSFRLAHDMGLLPVL